MRTLPILLVGLLLAAGLAGFFLSSGGDPAPVDPLEQSAPPDAPHATATDLEGADRLVTEQTPGASESARTHVVAEAPVDKQQAAEEPEQPVSGSGFEAPLEVGYPVHVVEEDGTPVPFAEVSVVDNDDVDELVMRETMQSGSGVGAVFEAVGRHFRADEYGQLLVPEPRLRAVVRGRGPGMEGIDELYRRDDPPFVLRLSRDAVFVVTVTDPKGQPVSGALVSLRATSDDGESVEVVQARTEGGTGSASLPNVLRSMIGDNAERADGLGSVSVCLAGFFAEPQQVEVDWRSTTPREMALVRPAVGSVDVLAVRPDGTRIQAPFFAVLARPELEPDTIELDELQPTLWLQQALREGVARFEDVEAGLELRAYIVQGEDQVVAATDVQVAREPDGRTEVELVVDLPVPRLAGRAVLAGGNALAHASLRVGHAGFEPDPGSEPSRWYSDDFQAQMRVVTDVEGRFELEAPWVADAPEGTMRVALRYRADAGSQELGGRRDVRTPVLEGQVDLGDLVLREPPLLAAGRVVDETGAPAVGMVFARPQSPDPAGGRPRRAGPTQYVETDREGRFEAHVESTGETVSLDFRGPGHLLNEETSVPIGSDDVLMVVQTAGSIILRVEGIPLEHVHALELRLTEGESGGHRGLEVREDGTVHASPLTPETYGLSWSTDTGQALTVPGREVFVTAGTEHDLGGVDLSEHVTVYTFEISLDDPYLRGELEVYGYDADGERVTRANDERDQWVILSSVPIAEAAVELGGDFGERVSVRPGHNLLSMP